MRLVKSLSFVVSLSALFLLNIRPSHAQDLAFLSFKVVLNASDTMRIGHIDLGSCTYSTLREASGGLVWVTDITLDSEGEYYSFTPVFFNSPSINRLTRLKFGTPKAGTVVERFDESKQGMTCDKMGGLYLAGEELSRWQDNTITELGELPPGMSCRGDLTFRQGKLYLSSVQHQLVEVDIDNPMNSSVFM